jgi:hypothetical protein
MNVPRRYRFKVSVCDFWLKHTRPLFKKSGPHRFILTVRTKCKYKYRANLEQK